MLWAIIKKRQEKPTYEYISAERERDSKQCGIIMFLMG